MRTSTSDGREVRTWRNRARYVDDPRFPDDARYTVRGMPGIAYWVLGLEVEADEDTEWSGIENVTDTVLAVMVGDDYVHRLDADDLTLLGELDYCAVCGQVGCTHDGRDREEA